MRIAQIAPLAESVPPKLYGGTERVVSYLTEELVRAGHDVTLFASGDSETAARLVPVSSRALRFDPDIQDPLLHNLLLIEEVRKRAHEFDVLHFHVDLLHFPAFRQIAGRTVTTLHGRLDYPGFPLFFGEFADMPLVSISHAQRRPVPHACWVANVPHGLPATPWRPTARRSPPYLAFLGRISREKRPDRAIAIARRSGVPLKIAAKVDRAEQSYFQREIRPLLDHPGVEWIGEIGETQKPDFLGNALALLFPIDWPEPFGLVMIEAMACGTPTIAYPHGSVPEVIDHGASGLIVENDDEAVAAVRAAAAMDRGRVRACFERRFTVERMAQSYVRVYEALASRHPAADLLPAHDEEAAGIALAALAYRSGSVGTVAPAAGTSKG